MRNHHPIDDSNDDYVLCVLRRGAADFRYTRADAAMLSSEAVLTMNGEAGTFTGHTPTLLTNIRLKRELLSHRVVDADSVAGQRISSKEVALRLLLSYSDVLADPEANIDADTGRIITGNIYDLAALTIGPVDARAHMRGVRAARLYALKQDVRRNLVHASLSIGEVAQRHGISASYARRLFADANTSFSDYLLEQRLVAAHRLLTDPLRASMTISAVAYDVGFGDLSYFNRTFRRRFGMTPSEVRIVGSS
jgi:AraC-like DNA-binding protein